MDQIVLDGPRGIRLRCGVPQRAHERLQGLRRAGPLDPSHALLLPNATSVHTFGLRFPLLIARLDRSLVVVDVRRLGPRRLLLPTFRAAHVLECSTAVALRPGDALSVAPFGSEGCRDGDGYTASAVPGGWAPIV